MKVRTITRFHDIESGKIRELGEEFNVKSERGKMLIQKRFVDKAEEEKEEPAE